MRIRALVKSVLVLVGTIGLLLGTGAPAGAIAQGYSGQWSGLVSGGGRYSAVTADVIVPRITGLCSANSNVVAYIGLGGYTSLPFVQNGFTVTPRGLGVWYEVFDRNGNGATVGVPLPIRQGDKVRLKLVFTGNYSVLGFSWENLTLHKAVTRVITNARRYYNGSTADYIVERSWFPYRGAPLARFAPIIFTGARGLQSGRWKPAYNSGTTRVTLLNGRGGVIARSTALNPYAFRTDWLGCS